MVKKHWKTIRLIVLIGTVLCIVAYADKSKGKKVEIPASIEAAIQKLYPQAKIEKVKIEKEGIKVFEIVLKLENGQEIELTVASDGTIIGIESEIPVSELPQVVAAKITGTAAGAQIKGVKKELIYYEVKLVKLSEPKTVYEAGLVQDGSECEIEIAADGTILKQSRQEKKTENDGDDEEEHEDEVLVSIEQVPSEVKAAILKEAQGGTIKKIERETEKGQTVYEAEVIINGKQLEIKVAANGTVLSKEEGEHEDDDKDDDN